MCAGRVERALEPAGAQQRGRAPELVDVADLVGDLDLGLGRDLLLDQRHREQRRQVLGPERLLGARVKRRQRLARQVAEQVHPMGGDRGLRQRELGLLAGAQRFSSRSGRWPILCARARRTDWPLFRLPNARYPGPIVRVLRGLEAPLGSVDGSAESPRFTWLMGALLFGAGASVGALSLLVPHPESFNEAALWSIVAIACVGGVAALLLAGSAPAWPVHILISGAIGLVTAAAYFSHDPSGFYTLFYVWIGLFVVFFFSRRTALLYVGSIALAYAALLIAEGTPGGPARWIATVGTIGLSAIVIDWLVRRVRSSARERAELLSALAEVAHTDDLTGLPNRRAWDEALDRELARAGRENTPLCIGLVDLDRFKLYNDDHGHQAGDRLLKEIASAWRWELRSTDVLARYGGEEFALALPGCDVNDAGVLLERLRVATPERADLLRGARALGRRGERRAHLRPGRHGALRGQGGWARPDRCRLRTNQPGRDA